MDSRKVRIVRGLLLLSEEEEMAMAEDRRSCMLEEIATGGQDPAAVDGRAKTVLIRGCDPLMADRAGKMLSPLLGHATIISATEDTTFLPLLESRTFDAILIAPGACRHAAKARPIPGSCAATHGWTLADYRKKIHTAQPGVPIVDTVEERLIVSLLREALDLAETQST